MSRYSHEHAHGTLDLDQPQTIVWFNLSPSEVFNHALLVYSNFFRDHPNVDDPAPIPRKSESQATSHDV